MQAHVGIGAAVNLPSFNAVPGFPAVPDAFQPSVNAVYGFGLGLGVDLAPHWSLLADASFSMVQARVRSNESTTISVDGKPIAASITHTFALDYSAVDGLVALRYAAGRVTYTAGIAGRVAIDAQATQSQELEDPPASTIVSDPVGPKAMPGTSRIVPVLHLGLDAEGADVGTLRMDPILALSIPLLSLSSSVQWTMPSISIGIRVRQRPSSPPTIISDSVWVRDTVLRSVASTGERGIYLLQRSTDTSVFRSEHEEHRTVTIAEHYERTVPEPAPVVFADVRAAFVDPAGNEVPAWKASYTQHTNIVRVPMNFRLRLHRDTLQTSAEHVNLPPLTDTVRHRDVAIAMIANNTSAVLDVLRASADVDVRAASAQEAEITRSWLQRMGVRARIHVHISTKVEGGEVALDARPKHATYQERSWPTLLLEPIHVRFHADVRTDDDVSQWSLEIRNDTGRVDVLEGSGAVPKTLDWNVDQRTIQSVRTDMRFTYVLTVLTRAGQRNTTDAGEIHIAFGAVREVAVERRDFIPALDGTLIERRP